MSSHSRDRRRAVTHPPGAERPRHSAVSTWTKRSVDSDPTARCSGSSAAQRGRGQPDGASSFSMLRSTIASGRTACTCRWRGPWPAGDSPRCASTSLTWVIPRNSGTAPGNRSTGTLASRTCGRRWTSSSQRCGLALRAHGAVLGRARRRAGLVARRAGDRGGPDQPEDPGSSGGNAGSGSACARTHHAL